jgi:hypothetical protein
MEGAAVPSVPLWVLVERVDVVAKEACLLAARVRRQRFGLAEVQVPCLTQDPLPTVVLELLGF